MEEMKITHAAAGPEEDEIHGTSLIYTDMLERMADDDLYKKEDESKMEQCPKCSRTFA